MNDSEIIKGLERLSAEDPDGFSADILELINHQRAEIKYLKKKLRWKKRALFNQQTYTAELQNALEAKCDNCDNIRLSRPEYWRAVSQAKSEAYKEFAAQLKQHARKMRGYDLCEAFWDYAVLVEDVDSILKEIIKRLAGEED